jgi:peroxiredoxin
MVHLDLAKWRYSPGQLLASVGAMSKRTIRLAPTSSAVTALPLLAMSALLSACHPHTAEKADPGEVFAAGARDALVGRRAPAVVLEGVDGGNVALADLIGRKPIYLKFWATWCKPCREQMPHLEAAHRRYETQLATYAVALGVNDPIETVRAFRAEHALTVPFAIDRDGSLAERFHVSVTPQHVLIDRAGIVRYVGHGATAELDRALEALVHDTGAPAAAPERAVPAADQPLSLSLRDGSTFTMAGQAGRPVALTFVSAWCDGYLAKTRPAMSEACIAHEHQAESQRRSHDGVVWIVIAHPVWTSPADLDEYRTQSGLGAPIGLDGGGLWFHRFGVRDVPVTILLDEHGAEIARVTGRGDDLPHALSLATKR